ncbi:NAD(P)H-binding protein [Kitasatospora sp. NPDC058965]|uniref:NAD(P)H-binding protein n=1 Tax=Kitasatospora sp. NPDC058965 TaxID=3346682 RepID=UPI0036A70D86
MILVTGATGNVGRHVVAQLVEQGHAVRVLTRRPEQVDLPATVEVAAGDLTDPDALAAALKDVQSVFLFAAPGSGPGFVAAAERAGVRHVVLLSSGAVDDAAAEQANLIAAYHWEIEQALRASALSWTFLRAYSFAANTLAWAGQTKGGDVIRGAYAGATAAPVHEADLAEVAVLALTTPGHQGRIHELTGPDSLTHAEQAALLGRALQRPLSYQELPAEVAREAMSAFVPGPVLDAIFSVWSASVGHPARTTGTVETLLGRPARSYLSWAQDHAAAF